MQNRTIKDSILFHVWVLFKISRISQNVDDPVVDIVDETVEYILNSLPKFGKTLQHEES